MDIIYRYDPFAPLIPRQSMDAQRAIRELEEGHQRFRNVVMHVQKELVGNARPGSIVIPSDPLSLGFALIASAPVQQALMPWSWVARTPASRSSGSSISLPTSCS